MKLVVKNNGTAEGSLEHLSFYLQNLQVLGAISKAYADHEVVFTA